jgi:hypothetical protein|tara:strand:- start:2683 stop:3048 length:366 start_codon:yes stop_codon:yes gene_type:complete
MPAITLTFPNPLNTSVQVGDVAYYTNTTTVGVHQSSNLANVLTIGLITSITPWNGNNSFIVCNMPVGTVPPPQGSFIMFSKDNKVNMSSILGYYAEVEFRNDSKTKAELFSVGTEVFESSK